MRTPALATILVLASGVLLTACVNSPISPPDPAEMPSSATHTIVSEEAELPVLFMPHSAGMDDAMSEALFRFTRNSAAGTSHVVVIKGPGANGPVQGETSSLGVKRAGALRRALELGGIAVDRIKVVSGGRAWSVLVTD